MKILELMEKYGLEVTKQGNLYVTYCPFHRDEHRPNFTIYEETDSYFCYTCSKGGNAIAFFARMEKISYAEAQHRLYSDLQSLRNKINKVKEPKSYNDVANMQLSKQVRRLLYLHPNHLSKVMKLMQEVDEKLTKNISQDDAIRLVTDVNIQLNNIVLDV